MIFTINDDFDKLIAIYDHFIQIIVVLSNEIIEFKYLCFR